MTLLFAPHANKLNCIILIYCYQSTSFASHCKQLKIETLSSIDHSFLGRQWRINALDIHRQFLNATYD